VARLYPVGSKAKDKSAMEDKRPRRRFDYFGLLTLLALLALLGSGWLLFPKLHSEMMWQDCVASGRTNCETR
jgi:hypothetical protein